MKHNLYLQVLEARFPFLISLLGCSSVSIGGGSYKGDLWAQDMNKNSAFHKKNVQKNHKHISVTKAQLATNTLLWVSEDKPKGCDLGDIKSRLNYMSWFRKH